MDIRHGRRSFLTGVRGGLIRGQHRIVTFDGPMLTADGHIPLRDVPGIGVEIDEDALRRYAVKDMPFFE